MVDATSDEADGDGDVVVIICGYTVWERWHGEVRMMIDDDDVVCELLLVAPSNAAAVTRTYSTTPASPRCQMKQKQNPSQAP
jgi:hypothetical protein